MADEKKDLEPIDTSGRTRMRPVPLSFGGVKRPDGKRSWLPWKRKREPEEARSIDPALDALPEGVKVEDPRRIIRTGLLVVFIFFGLMGLWAVFGTISGAVIAPGKIKIESERKIVQHLEGGIVEDILVKEGEEVTAGQTLLILESVQIDSSTAALGKQLVALEAQGARYAAEKDGKETLSWPDDLKHLAESSGNMDVLASEERIFQTRQDSLNTHISLLQTQIKQLESQVGGFDDQLRAERKIISTLREELNAKRQLFKERYVEKSQILSLERDLANHEGIAGRIRQSIAEAKQKVTELNLRINEQKISFVDEATRALGSIENELVQIRERLRPLEDAKRRLRVTAPCNGKVVDLKVHTKGSVVRGGETLMDIVPGDNPLIVDTQVPVNRITEVYVGQPAQVQMDAFDTRILPLVPGKVTYISADRLEPEHAPGMPYYLCYVEVDPESLKKYDLYLSPGMPVTVFITTNEKSILRYMIDPLVRNWNTALRE